MALARDAERGKLAAQGFAGKRFEVQMSFLG
jgi:hypothetical protein